MNDQRQSKSRLVDECEIKIARRIYDQDSFNETYADDNSSSTERSAFRRCRRKLSSCSPGGAGRCLLQYFPVVRHLREYRWKEWILNDIVSGISGGVVHVPQAMGYALLAGLPPVYGLYTSIFPGWLYYVFGTSRHLSVGTMALTSLLVGGVVSKLPTVITTTIHNQTTAAEEQQLWNDNVTTAMALPAKFDYNQTYYDVPNGSVTVSSVMQSSHRIDDPAVSFKVGIALSVTLIAGIFQLLMRLLRLGLIATYMSGPFISAFMTASALQIIVSQIPFQLGLKIRRPYGTFEMPLTLVEVFVHITETNLSALTASAISIIFLVVIKEGINEKFKDRLKVPIPAELILVVIATLIAHFAQLTSRFGLAVIGPIPTGLPVPRAPPMTSFTSYIVDGCIIGLVGFAIAISMAKLMAERHKYQIDTNQELLATSIPNIVCPFFGCFMSTQAPPRTMVHETTGCRTQLTGFISTFLPLLVVLYIGPLFESLPISVLACVISCALIPLMKQFKELRTLWLISRYDFITWIVTFICTTLISVTAGLVIGIGLSILMVMIQLQRVNGTLLHQAGDTEIYYGKHGKSSPSQCLQCGVMVFRFEGSVLFVNAEKFVDQLYKRTFNPIQAARLISRHTTTSDVTTTATTTTDFASSCNSVDSSLPEKERDTDANAMNMVDLKSDIEKSTSSVSSSANDVRQTDVVEVQQQERPRIKAIVLDCGRMSHIDMVGLNAIKKVRNAYDACGTALMFAGCDKHLLRLMQAVGLVGQGTSGTGGNTADSDDSAANNNNSEASSRSGQLQNVFPTVHDAVMSTQLKLCSHASKN